MSDKRGVKIPNPVNLNKKVPELPRGSVLDPVTRAQQALEKLSGTFEVWMEREIKRLNDAWSNVDPEGLNIVTFGELYAVAHDIKGEGATFGFPLASDVAGSLCKLMDAFEAVPDRAPMPLVKQHVLSIKAIVNEKAQNSADPIGRQLVAELATQTDRVIAALRNR